MPRLNIYKIENLSKRSWIPQDFLIELLKLDSKWQKKYFFDHKKSKDWKHVRVVQYWSTLMRKFQEWLWNELVRFDRELLFMINGWVEKKSVLNAINIHIRNRPFTFIKSDISTFFESIPRERVFSLFCAMFNCGKDVAEIICNCICFNKGAIWTSWNISTLGRWLNCSSRVAIWCSIQFFRKFFEDITNKYRSLDPRISYYVDDIGISIITTEELIAKSFLEEMKQLPKKKYWNIDFLQLHEWEKTKFKILLTKDDFAEYLGSRIYINRKDVSIEWIDKVRTIYHQAQKTENKKARSELFNKVGAWAKYRKRIQAK